MNAENKTAKILQLIAEGGSKKFAAVKGMMLEEGER